MDDLSGLNQLFASAAEILPGKRKTPTDVGNSLFRDLLLKDSSSRTNEVNGTGPSGRGALGGGGAAGKKGNTLESLEGAFGNAGLSTTSMRLPGTAAAQIIAFLERQGLGREKIDQLILSSTDRDGMIRVDRIMAGLRKSGAGSSEKFHVVESRDVSQLEGVLFNMGLGVGEVKALIEKSSGPRGEVIVEKMAGAMSGLFSEAPSSKELISLFREFGIKSVPQEKATGLGGAELEKALKVMSEGATEDVQQKIKQELAQLLRQKGVPPQEVKSFLEGLTVTNARGLLKEKDAAAANSGKGQGAGEAADFLNRVVIRSRQGWTKGGGQEQILQILKNENILVGQELSPEGARTDMPLRLNLSELTKILGTQAGARQLEPIQVQDRVRGQEIGLAGQKETRNQAGTRVEPGGLSQGREGLGGGVQNSKISTDGPQTGSVNQSRSAVSLPEPLPKILDKMSWMIQSGEQKSRLVISPPELGRLDLNLVMRQGHLQVNLGAETLAVKELIDQNLNQLKQQLTDQGLVVEQFEVTVGLDNRRFQEEDPRTAGGRKGSSSKRSRAGLEIGRGERPAVSSTPRLGQIDVHV